jgi:hypothetical protein
MNDESHLLQAAFAWWLPDLQKIDNPGVNEFRRVMTLSSSVLSGWSSTSQNDSPAVEDTTLDGAFGRSARLIASVLRGEPTDQHLAPFAHRSDLGRTLESQVRLWLFGRTENDYVESLRRVLKSDFPENIQCQLFLQISLLPPRGL